MAASIYSAQAQYGMVGYGAGPDRIDTTQRVNGTSPAVPTAGKLMADPTFWMVATLGVTIALAAYSAGGS